MESTASSDGTPSGQVALLTPTQVKVGCQAPQTTDGAGQPVNYAPEQLSDGRLNTAWRCNGDGVGQVVTFEFPAGTSIVEVGLVNGTPRWTGQRRQALRRVPPDHQGDLDLREWRLLSAVAEGRDDNHAEVEHSVPAGDRVTLTVEASTDPGSTARGRDAVVISEVVFGHSP